MKGSSPKSTVFNILKSEETMCVQTISIIMEAIILGYFKMNTTTS